MRCKD